MVRTSLPSWNTRGGACINGFLTFTVASTHLTLENTPHLEPINQHLSRRVQGIALATNDNGLGITGVIDDASNICLSIARIFPDSGQGQRDSVVLDAVDWCSTQNARIINLSLGSSASGTPAAERLYRQLQEDGVLVISSSGNGYNADYNYPASFDTVVSVGAIDSDGKRASFSNYNDQVNIVAPGVAIRSTSPLSAISDGTYVYEMRAFEYSQPVGEQLAGYLHDAGSGNSDHEYENARGKICIAQRGTISFLDKALLCEKHGGIALVVYNNVTGLFAGTLMEEGIVSIPAVGVSQVDGALLKRRQSTVTISPLVAGYSTRSGTSMATAFVSGVAAKLWAARPACTNEQIRQALYQSASKTNLIAGPEGFDESFGSGLLQADAAYQLLMKNPPPCGGPVEASSSTNSAAGPWWKSGSQTPVVDSSSSSSTSSSSTSSSSPSSSSLSSLTSKPPLSPSWQWSGVSSTASNESNDPEVSSHSNVGTVPDPHNNESKSIWGTAWRWLPFGNGRRKALRRLQKSNNNSRSRSSGGNGVNTGDSITLDNEIIPVPE